MMLSGLSELRFELRLVLADGFPSDKRIRIPIANAAVQH